MFSAAFDFLRQHVAWICVVWLLACALVVRFMQGARRARPYVEPRSKALPSPASSIGEIFEVAKKVSPIAIGEFARGEAVRAGAENGMGC